MMKYLNVSLFKYFICFRTKKDKSHTTDDNKTITNLNIDMNVNIDDSI